MTIELDGRLMTDRATAHEYLKTSLRLPDHYGRNLDALFDLLTEIGTATEITVLHTDAITDNLGNYGTSLLNTLRDAAGKNPHIHLEFL